ncbi:hypothetical protein [Mucilaginibacter sp. 3215]|uniref:hypothetical protein n=1 Tax=Mucilaginibacter sp. 3215 TaxID=3373912 RepID=UPI003D23790E
MTKPELSEIAKKHQKMVINSIIKRTVHEEIKTTALYLQKLMAEKGMDIPKPATPKTPEQIEYMKGRMNGTIQRDYINE